MKRQILILLAFIGFAMTTFATDYAYDSKGSLLVTWNNKDVVGLYTVSGTRIRTTVKNIDATNRHRVTLTGNGWTLTSDSQYYGYYPYSSSYQLNGNVMTALPVSYNSQAQTANNNLDHLASYDYMVAQTTTTETEANFTFAHYGSIIRFACYVPATTTFSSLEITSKAEDAIFTTEANMNLTNQTLTSTSKSKKATLTLNNITIASGDSLIAYMMMPPTDLSGKSIMLSLNATDGSALQTYIAGVNIQSGKVYPVSVGKENYFKVSTSGGNDNSEEVLSLQADMGEKRTTEQITTATAYATDFTLDAVNELKPFLLGDVNLDGVVNVTDAVIVINHYQARTTEELDFNVSDVNGDNNINVTDAVGIINIYQSRLQ